MCVTCAGHVHDGMLWAEKFMPTSWPKGTGTAMPSCMLRTTTTAEALPKAAPQWKQP